MRFPLFAPFLLLLALPAMPVQAHQLTPAIVDARVQPDGVLMLQIGLNLEALLSGIDASHQDSDDAPQAARYNALRATGPKPLRAALRDFRAQLLRGLELKFDETPASLSLAAANIPEVGDTRLARVSRLTVKAQIPEQARQFTFRYAPSFGDAVLRIHAADSAEPVIHWLSGGATSPAFAFAAANQAPTFGQTLVQYTGLGFTHILPLGVDHILFVLGLFLLSIHLRPVLIQVTAFTLAHTITLALTILGLISLPDSLVEPLIALSIVYVGLENIVTREVRWHRVIVIFLFGLLHGMGFAGVLNEIGLPEGQFVAALISFNVGVELGQLAVIGLAFAAVGYWFRDRDWYRARIVIPFSLLVSVVGGFWFVERVGWV